MPEDIPVTAPIQAKSAFLSARSVGYVLLTLVLLGSFFSVARKDWTELPLYLRAASRLKHGEPIYRHDERPWTYPALFALPFMPLLSLPVAVQAPLWHALNCAIVVFLVWRVERRILPYLRSDAGIVRRVPVWLFCLLVLVLAGRYVLSPIENQSHDLVVFLCVMLTIDARCTGADISAGFWAGLGAALKATPLLFLPMFLWQRRFRAAVAMVVVIPVLLLLPDVLCPANDGISWTEAWHREFLTAIQPGATANSRGAWHPWCQLNQSLAGTLQRLLAPLQLADIDPKEHQVDVSLIAVSPLSLRLATLAGQSAIFLTLLWVMRPGIRTGQSARRIRWMQFGQQAAVVTAMVLLSPTSIKTHFGVLLLPVVFCLADYGYQRRDPIVGVALGVTFVLGSLTVKDLLGQNLGNRVMAAGSVTWCALTLLLTTTYVVARRSRPRQSAERQPSATPLIA